jgi:predicted metal-binding protein
MARTAQMIKYLLALAETAKAQGCCEAEPLLAREIVVDPRVRLKCRLNLCGQFGQNLMCPPKVWDLAETSAILARYTFSLLVQITRQADPSEYQTVFDREKIAMSAIIVSLEQEAFRNGFSLAVGLGSGHCQLCPDCAGDDCPSFCRLPSRARPSLEAVGIDVEKTCAAAGLPAGFAPGRVTLTGLLLLD